MSHLNVRPVDYVPFDWYVVLESQRILKTCKGDDIKVE